MRKALFIFVLIICLTFAACGDTPVDQPDSPSVTYGNQDASAPVDSQPVDNPDNVTDTETAPNGEVVPYNELQTDMYLSSEKRVDSDGTVTEVKYTYDSEGRLLSALASDGSGNKYEYPDYSTDITYFQPEEKLIKSRSANTTASISLCQTFATTAMASLWAMA